MGMKPYYTTKQIDGEGFMERLKNIGTMNYYDEMVPEIEPTTDGHKLWVSEQDYDPWERLAAALISHACKEYAQAYISHNRARMLEIEHWLTDFEFARPAFYELQYQLRKAEQKGRWYLQWFEHSIKVLW